MSHLFGAGFLRVPFSASVIGDVLRPSLTSLLSNLLRPSLTSLFRLMCLIDDLFWSSLVSRLFDAGLLPFCAGLLGHLLSPSLILCPEDSLFSHHLMILGLLRYSLSTLPIDHHLLGHLTILETPLSEESLRLRHDLAPLILP